ncbi:hypothetical protein AUJ42_03310 [Candidatus Collierbacteria bacterium CG1_02_44_10]|uniref:Ribulose-phosphate 3-epimerase n=1 Tax=Candidatus Collierbacteria bacterium CG1_02_44_10 TaxID=1805087 RepID=A0A1J4RSA8_9BACT|nr:MAG: hypothetical protein AUJ42_03310 [Candidatus Collierbacteria bacterium CG1_02_44_10]
MKLELIPAILSHDADDAQQKAELCTGYVSTVQLDVMDGTFVKNTTWHQAAQAKRWPKRLHIELHLMVQDPLMVMKSWKNTSQFTRAIWHAEASVDSVKLLDWCKRNKIQGGIALNPETPVEAITPYVYHPAFSRALILGVHPGRSGQKLIPSTKKKARQLHALRPKLPIAFDGGVSLRNIESLARNGVTTFCAASAIFKTKDPKGTLQHFLDKLDRVGHVL